MLALTVTWWYTIEHDENDSDNIVKRVLADRLQQQARVLDDNDSVW